MEGVFPRLGNTKSELLLHVEKPPKCPGLGGRWQGDSLPSLGWGLPIAPVSAQSWQPGAAADDDDEPPLPGFGQQAHRSGMWNLGP